jgi:hypothetical protein
MIMVMARAIVKTIVSPVRAAWIKAWAYPAVGLGFVPRFREGSTLDGN